MLCLIGGGGYGCGGIIKNNIISYNVSFKGGGLQNCLGLIQNNTINYNRAEKDFGGGISVALQVNSNIISHNFAAMSGGGVDSCFGPVVNNFIYKNSCGTLGGGLAVCRSLVANNTIVYNQSIHAEFGTGGGIALCDGDIQNNIIWANIASADSQIRNSSVPTFSLIQDWTEGGVGNITFDPLFVNPKKDDYHLQPGSPAIDAGSTTTLFTDFDGDPRPIDGDRLGAGSTGDGSDIDIGADEFVIPGFFFNPRLHPRHRNNRPIQHPDPESKLR